MKDARRGKPQPPESYPAKPVRLKPPTHREGGEFAGKGVLIPFETVNEAVSAMEAFLSPSAASVITHELARRCGAASCRRTVAGAEMREDVLVRLCELKEEENWGRLSFHDVDFERGCGRVSIVNSFEAVARGDGPPRCHFFRGFLAGFLSELFGKPITVLEERCAAEGGERCEFRFADSLVLYAEEARQLVKNIAREAASKCSSGNL